MAKKKDTIIEEAEKIQAELDELKKKKKILGSSPKKPTKKAEAKPTKKTKKAEAKPSKKTKKA